MSPSMICRKAIGHLILVFVRSDQGYHNYLYDTGKFAEAGLRIKANAQGTGVVNTIGKQIPTLCLAPTLTLSLSHSLATPLSGSSRPVIHTRAIQQGL